MSAYILQLPHGFIMSRDKCVPLGIQAKVIKIPNGNFRYICFNMFAFIVWRTADRLWKPKTKDAKDPKKEIGRKRLECTTID